MAVFGVPTFCLITGASRGIGQAVSVEMAENVGVDSVFVLTARSEAGLQETKRLIEARRSTGIVVRTVACDLGEMDVLSTNVTRIFADLNPHKFEHAILVHNAGSVGDITKTVREMDNPRELQDYFGFNITSAICLTSKFINTFKPPTRGSIINISSGNAHIPFGYLSMYCTSKAARDMLFRVLALEEPDIRVLNYKPGPVDTDMQTDIREHTGNLAVKKIANDVLADGKVLPPETVAKIMMKILEEDSYASGSSVKCVDYVSK